MSTGGGAPTAAGERRRGEERKDMRISEGVLGFNKGTCNFLSYLGQETGYAAAMGKFHNSLALAICLYPIYPICPSICLWLVGCARLPAQREERGP